MSQFSDMKEKLRKLENKYGPDDERSVKQRLAIEATLMPDPDRVIDPEKVKRDIKMLWPQE